MTTKEIAGGTVHNMPADLHKALVAGPKVRALWEDRRVRRTCEELLEGKRRPCCWVGCIHRTDKPISRSARWVLDKQSKRPA